MAQLIFAWRAVKSVKSNAILLAKGTCTVGVGGGQPNRVNSARIAVEQAGEKAKGSVAASDAFLPFADSPNTLSFFTIQFWAVLGSSPWPSQWETENPWLRLLWGGSRAMGEPRQLLKQSFSLRDKHLRTAFPAPRAGRGAC